MPWPTGRRSGPTPPAAAWNSTWSPGSAPRRACLFQQILRRQAPSIIAAPVSKLMASGSLHTHGGHDTALSSSCPAGCWHRPRGRHLQVRDAPPRPHHTAASMPCRRACSGIQAGAVIDVDEVQARRGGVCAFGQGRARPPARQRSAVLQNRAAMLADLCARVMDSVLLHCIAMARIVPCLPGPPGAGYRTLALHGQVAAPKHS